MMLSNEKLHRYNIIWRKVLKSGFLNANRMPLREHEDIMVFYKSQPVYNPQMVKGQKNHSKGKAKGENAEDILNNRVYGAYKVVETTGDMKHPSSIWEFPKPHPSVAISSTEKPVELCRYAIRTLTEQKNCTIGFNDSFVLLPEQFWRNNRIPLVFSYSIREIAKDHINRFICNLPHADQTVYIVNSVQLHAI